MNRKKDPPRCTGHVGGTEKRWLAEEVDGLDPQYCRPGGPAIANHLTRHEVHHQVSRRRVASDARTRAPEHRGGDDKARSGSFAAATAATDS